MALNKVDSRWLDLLGYNLPTSYKRLGNGHALQRREGAAERRYSDSILCGLFTGVVPHPKVINILSQALLAADLAGIPKASSLLVQSIISIYKTQPKRRILFFCSKAAWCGLAVWPCEDWSRSLYKHIPAARFGAPNFVPGSNPAYAGWYRIDPTTIS